MTTRRVNPKKQGNPVNQAFDFWIENKIANKRTFFTSDIKQYFKKWLKTKEKKWLQYYTSRDIITVFIADKNGLNAVCDKRDIDEIVRLLISEYNKVCLNSNIK